MKGHSGKQTARRNETLHAYRVPTKEDGLQADMTAVATDAAIAALKPIVKDNPHKLLVNLARHEMEGMVVAAVTAYETHRRHLEVLDDLNDDISDVGMAG